MRNLVELILKALKKYKSVFGPSDFDIPEHSNLADLTLKVFSAAGKMGRKPDELAEDLTLILEKLPQVKSASAEKGFVNIFFKTDFLNQAVFAEKEQSADKKQKIMIEYSQPNTHKEFHVGHLRNACLGSAIVNLNRSMGHKVTATNYIGDTGSHVAKCLWALKKFHAEDEEPVLKGKYLGEIYAEAVRKLAKNPELEKQVSEVHTALENEDKEMIKLWGKTKEWSLRSFNDIYELLDIQFDEWFWESEEEKEGKEMLTKLLKSGKVSQIKESQGAIIADLSEFSLDVLVLIKSDGNLLYGAKDLPLGKKKFDKFKINKSVYVVDSRQSLYLKQVFKLLDLLGYEKKEKIHVAYDFVTLPEGAMASRKGNVVTFEDLFDEVVKKAQAETLARHADWSKEKIAENAIAVALAAIKFWMLKYDNASKIVFDTEKAMAFDGDTGPYLLYTIARIKSIFEQSAYEEIDLDEVNTALLNQTEAREVVLQLAQFDKYRQLAAEKNSPHYLAGYLLNLAKSFNNFYHQVRVLDTPEEDRKARLYLCGKTATKLERGLNLMNIKSVDQM